MDKTQLHNQVKKHSLPLIKHYHDDLLIHDKNAIDGKTPFLHFTGDTGTHIEKLIPANAYPARGEIVPYLFGKVGREHILNQIQPVIECMERNNRHDLVLYFNGKKLKQISMGEAKVITTVYVSSIKAQWRRAS